MEPTTPFEWIRLLLGIQEPLYLVEILLRVAIVYVAGVVVLSFADKRSRRQPTSFDLMILIALGSVIGDVMFYPEVPIVYALVVLLAVLVLNRVTARLQARFPPVQDFVAGRGTEVVRDGKILDDALRSESISVDELFSMLRVHEVSNTGEVRSATIEFSGDLGVIRFPPDEAREGRSTVQTESG